MLCRPRARRRGRRRRNRTQELAVVRLTGRAELQHMPPSNQTRRQSRGSPVRLFDRLGGGFRSGRRIHVGQRAQRASGFLRGQRLQKPFVAAVKQPVDVAVRPRVAQRLLIDRRCKPHRSFLCHQKHPSVKSTNRFVKCNQHANYFDKYGRISLRIASGSSWNALGAGYFGALDGRRSGLDAL